MYMEVIIIMGVCNYFSKVGFTHNLHEQWEYKMGAVFKLFYNTFDFV